MNAPTCVWYHIRDNALRVCLMQRPLHECQCQHYRPDPNAAVQRETAWRAHQPERRLDQP